LGCGIPVASVTRTISGAKAKHVWQINCPLPDTTAMFCADAVWAQKNPASTATRTMTLYLFKITSSFDARTRLDWDGRGENCSVPPSCRILRAVPQKKSYVGQVVNLRRIFNPPCRTVGLPQSARPKKRGERMLPSQTSN
jgi:hypothetical protein